MKDFSIAHKRIIMANKIIIGSIVALLASPLVYVEGEYTYCEEAFVPCPRAAGFQFFNRTCYGIIRDSLAFGTNDSNFKCESGMHLSFTDPSMDSQYLKSEQLKTMDLRITPARVASLSTLSVLSKLRRQVVSELTENTLVDLACREDCRSPDSWAPAGSAAYSTMRSCATMAACNWQSGSRTVWAQPPGSPAAIELTSDVPVKLAPRNGSHVHIHKDADDDYVEIDEHADVDGDLEPLNNRRAVLAGHGALKDEPESISLHSVACELPFSTTDDEIQLLIPLGFAVDADMVLYLQLVQDLSIESVNDSRTAVRVTWKPPHCRAAEFYVSVHIDGEKGTPNRTQVQAEDVCDQATEICQMELSLPPCSLVYIQVGAILKGEDAAPDVVQWQTPAPEAPDAVHVLDTAPTWVILEWSHAAGESSPCVQAKYRVTCQARATASVPAVSVTSPDRALNVTGLIPGVGYRCGVCALASLMDTAPADTALIKPPCGDIRFVNLTTNETAPGKPHGLNVTDTGHTSLTLEWHRPQEPNGVIIRQRDRYHVTVAAATAVGQGPFCRPVSADTRVGGMHDYRLQFERVDFLAGYQSTVRAAMLKPDEIRQLYSGKRNITFSVFDGKWTPGFNYRVRIVAHTDIADEEGTAQASSGPVNFTMTVPPPGMVRHLKADCSSQPLGLSFSWANPTKNAFGIVSYRSQYQPAPTSAAPASASATTPVKRFNFMGERTYYFNCTCELREVTDAPVMPGSECQVTVQAESKYLQQRGETTLAVCRTPEYTVKVTDLKISCEGHTLTLSWDVPRPVEVPTKAYHVNVQRSTRDTGQMEKFVQETLGESVQQQLETLSGWREDLDPSRQYLLRLPSHLYDAAAGTLREVRVVVYEPGAVTSNISPLPPPSGNITQLPQATTWQQFELNRTNHYLASPPAFIPDSGKPNTTYAVQLMFVNDAGFVSSRPFIFRTKSVREAQQEEAERTKAETEKAEAERAKAEAEGGKSDEKPPDITIQQTQPNVDPLSGSGDGWRETVGKGDRSGDLPKQQALPAGTARMGDGEGIPPADNGTTEVPANATTPEPGVAMGTAVGASAGVLAALSSICAGALLWRRRSRASGS
ncbi:hypothetical protein FJT64_022511 [Amphibalanus amphitrite]|uniref:Fibronectin type-III domain-containing protein n=1 Tax=Amphibalanus amphitrite TaxID=1232801 RepID=A0A6A4WTI9_AMPAM|nr:hypothetical protein FJT64_022511 [Amphibalanus amphitrite]KAF0305963.1 hypothetical protein FJT64_022511 [Amphibalanus amphitrite]